MAQKLGFDNEKYLEEQRSAILKRMESFDSKLYLEFGGKLLFDYHAARVLPGFDPNVKIRLLQQFRDEADIILCIFAGDIERKKVRADFGFTYDVDAMKLIDDLRKWDLAVTAVVITRFEEQPSAIMFKNKLERRGVKVYTHGKTKGYPADVDRIVSDKGYGANPHIETTKPLVVVTGPGPGSGKLATCLSQLYHEHKQGINSGYAKFETFPIWNVPLDHPVNIAYEAATADLRDFNQIDPFHLEAYEKVAINYNRDVEAFPVVRAILQRISGSDSMYSSPTDMGVNCAGFGIVDDDAVREASKQEIIRRHFRYACEYAMGLENKGTVEQSAVIMQKVDLELEQRPPVLPARRAKDEAHVAREGRSGIYVGAALELADGTMVTGKNSPVMHASSSLVLNAIKALAELPDKIHLLPPNIIESIGGLKKDVFGRDSVSLSLDETMIALSISATSNPSAQLAMEKLSELRGCEGHITHIPTPGDEAGLRRLGINMTSDPNFSSKNLFVS